MQLITTRNKESSFAELKKAISSEIGLELIRPGDKFAIELKNGAVSYTHLTLPTNSRV